MATHTKLRRITRRYFKRRQAFQLAGLCASLITAISLRKTPPCGTTVRTPFRWRERLIFLIKDTGYVALISKDRFIYFDVDP